MEYIKIVENPDNPKKLWTCLKCDKEFSRQDSMLRHMRMVHNAPSTKLDYKRKTGTPLKNNKGETKD